MDENRKLLKDVATGSSQSENSQEPVSVDVETALEKAGFGFGLVISQWDFKINNNAKMDYPKPKTNKIFLESLNSKKVSDVSTKCVNKLLC